MTTRKSAATETVEKPQTVDVLNIEDFASPTTTEVQLRHPVTKKLLNAFVEGYTPDSDEWAALEAKYIKPKQAKSLIISKKANSVPIDPEAAESRKKVTLESIIGIRGFNVEFDKKKRESLLSDRRYSWILEQWEDHLDDRANFFDKPAKS